MPALNFTVFLDKVTDGTKPHTIRATRKIPIKEGSCLSFYTGMRTKRCRMLRQAAPCIGAVGITIDAQAGTVTLDAASAYYPKGQLDSLHVEEIALCDGFPSRAAFFDYFRVKDGTFKGQLIEWGDKK